MNRATVWIFLVLVGLLVIHAAGRAIALEIRKSQLAAAGEAAASAGWWAEAFRSFRTLVELNPVYRDARTRLDDVIRRMPGTPDLQAEIEMLRWLAASGDEDRLAEALDHSVVTIPAGEVRHGQ